MERYNRQYSTEGVVCLSGDDCHSTELMSAASAFKSDCEMCEKSERICEHHLPQLRENCQGVSGRPKARLC